MGWLKGGGEGAGRGTGNTNGVLCPGVLLGAGEMCIDYNLQALLPAMTARKLIVAFSVCKSRMTQLFKAAMNVRGVCFLIDSSRKFVVLRGCFFLSNPSSFFLCGVGI